MRCRCPHCHNPIELVDDAELSDIPCPSCGSSFSLAPSETLTHDSKGQTIAHFELIETLGVGAFGTVWKAKDTQLDRTVAIKVPRKDQLDAQETEQFLREARAAAQLRHPNIVTVHEIGRDKDQVFIASDYIQGATLSDWVTGRQLSSREAAELCAKIGDALHHAHEEGVVHRDLKPSNIMIDMDGEPHIMDFGLAKREAGEITMTIDGKVLGTPAYMSPEQARGEAHIADGRSDVYSLGVVLFQLLTGELPFRGNPRMLLVQIIKDKPPSPRKLNGAVARDLETMCLKCLEKEPDRRYSTAQAFADDLRRYLIGEPIGARPVGSVEHAWRWARRHPARAAALTASGLAAFFAVGLLISYGYQQRLELTRDELVVSLDREKDLSARLVESKANLDRVLYLRRISQALSAWYGNEVLRAKRLLEDCPPNWRHWEWYYVNNLFENRVTTLKGHTDWVTHAALDRTGSRVVSGGRDETVRIWNALDGQELSKLNGMSQIWSLGISNDNRLIAGGSSTHEPVTTVTPDADGRVNVWELATAKRLLSTETRSGSFSFCPSNQRIAVARGHNLDIIDTTTGQSIFTLQGHKDLIQCVGYSPDGSYIVSGSVDQTLRVWDASSGKHLNTLRGHTEPIGALEFSGNGELLVSRGRPLNWGGTASARIWDITSGKEVSVLDCILGSQGGVVINNDGTVACCVLHRSRSALLFDAQTGQQIRSLDGHISFVKCAAFSSNGKRIATGSSDHTARVWHAETGEELFTFKGHTDVVTTVSFSTDGSRLLSGSRDGTLRIWQLQQDGDAHGITGHVGPVGCVRVSSDGRLIVSASCDRGGDGDNSIRVWDSESGEEIQAILLPQRRDSTADLISVALSPDGQEIVSSGDLTVRISNLGTGRTTKAIAGTAFCTAIASCPKSHLIAGAVSKAVKLWDSANWTETASFACENFVLSVAFSPDGTKIAAGEHRSATKLPRLKVWDVQSRRELLNLAGHSHNIQAVAFSPDGGRIATGSFDNTVKVWDAETGDEQLTLFADSWVYSVVFSPDGERIVAATDRGTIRLWDAETGQEALIIQAHDGPVFSVAFTPDCKQIVSGGYDGKVKIWDAGTTEFVQQLRPPN